MLQRRNPESHSRKYLLHHRRRSPSTQFPTQFLIIYQILLFPISFLPTYTSFVFFFSPPAAASSGVVISSLPPPLLRCPGKYIHLFSLRHRTAPPIPLYSVHRLLLRSLRCVVVFFFCCARRWFINAPTEAIRYVGSLDVAISIVDTNQIIASSRSRTLPPSLLLQVATPD